jgi:predicted CXXCH cytochrome family protein
MKIGLLAVFSVLVLAWAVSGTYSTSLNGTLGAYAEPLPTAGSSDDFVGSETCKACHEKQFKNFTTTKHSKLAEVPSWKDKAVGCESCHGSGKAHVEAGGDKTKIATFKGKNSKEISETCLACHSGRETHNNFRRGEHWRNDVGCTDCHSAHGGDFQHEKTGSSTDISPVSTDNPNRASQLMLKNSEPQLCMSCHTETKQQFSKPFHHKVLEGTMKCTDCHNAHGGFEGKQTKLSAGAEAVCVKCHTDKRGPFPFEHAPIKTEGCSVCHTPHGSSNPKMLNRSSVRQLCFECHSTLDTIDPTPQATHNVTQIRYINCTVCHARIHGSYANKGFTK